MILLQALKVHFVSFAVLLSFWLPIFHFTHYFHPFQLAVMEGLIACVLGMRLKMPLWWIPINMFFVPFVVVVYSFQIPPSIGFGIFLFIFLLNWNVFKDRVPLYLTSYKGKDVLATLIPSANDFKFIDLGCGLGGTITFLSKRFKNGKFVGVETAPFNYLFSKIRSFGKSNVETKFQDIWNHDLGDYDVVYAFLSPEPMPKLWKKAKKEMKKGSLFISNTFIVPGVKPSKTIELEDWRKSKIYLWKI